MTRDEILAVLRAHEPELRRRGVTRAALFGSSARLEAGEANDVDILVEIAKDAPVGVFEYVGVIQFLSDLFPRPVDVANRDQLKPRVRVGAERDAISAF